MHCCSGNIFGFVAVDMLLVDQAGRREIELRIERACKRGWV